MSAGRGWAPAVTSLSSADVLAVATQALANTGPQVGLRFSPDGSLLWQKALTGRTARLAYELADATPVASDAGRGVVEDLMRSPAFAALIRQQASDLGIDLGPGPEASIAACQARLTIPRGAPTNPRSQHRFTSIRTYLPGEVSDEALGRIQEAIEIEPSQAPAFCISCHLSERLQAQGSRRTKASDFFDARFLSAVAIADFVTTDAEVVAAVGDTAAFGARGRLFARADRERMLTQVERRVAGGTLAE